MKLGVENKGKTVAAVVLLGFALWYVIHSYTADNNVNAASNAPSASADTGVPAATRQPSAIRTGNAARPVRRPPAATSNRPSGSPAPVAVASSNTAALDPRLRLDLLKASENVTYEGDGRNIFQPEMEKIPEVKNPVIHEAPHPPAPVVDPGPPPPPPINLKFFGYASRPGQPRQIFLSENDDVFIAKEGDIVDRRYKVMKIGNDSVDIQDVLNNNTQTIRLTPQS